MNFPFQTAESLGSWPSTILARLFSAPVEDARFESFPDDELTVRGAFLRRRRLEALLQDGLVLHTNFSGKGSVETCFAIFDKVGKDRASAMLGCPE